MSRVLVAFIILLLTHIFFYHSFAQVIRTDSVNLISMGSTQITKVVSKTNRIQHLALGWQTNNGDSARLYFRLYSEKGTPLDTVVVLARAVNKVGRVAMDFDLAILSTGEILVAWSELVSSTNRYNLKYCLLNSFGNQNGLVQNLALSTTPFIKVAANNSGFMIAWNSDPSIVQFFNANGVAEDSPLTLSNHWLNATASVFDYTNEKNVFIGKLFKDQSSPPFAEIRGYTRSGGALSLSSSNSPPYSLETGDVSFGERKTVFSFSYESGTYFLMASKVMEGFMDNRVMVDGIASKFSQVAQNDNGSISIVWSTGLQVRMGIFHSSGQKTASPIMVPMGGVIPSSIDIMPGADSEASIVTAGNGWAGAKITLQRYRYLGVTETQEQVVSTETAPTGKVQSALSSMHTHLAVWQHRSTSQSAIFAQVYDSLFQKKGDPINVTGFISHTNLFSDYLFDFEAAIDSVGNFMVVWVTGDKDIYAAQFNPDGSVKLPKFKVNTSPGNIQMPPRLAASPNGRFVVFWNDTGGNLKARIIYANIDSGEKILKQFFWGTTDYERKVQNRVAINNRGEFVCTLRSGYYAMEMLIFDSLLTEVANPLHSDIFDTQSKMDIVMNNNQMIVSWAISGYINTGLNIQRFDTHGNKMGSLITVDKYVDYLRYPSIAMNTKNEFILAYADYPTLYRLQNFSSQGVMTEDSRRIATFDPTPELKISRNPKGDVFAVYVNDGYVTPGTSTGGPNIIAKGFFNHNKAPRQYYYTRVIEKGQSFHFGNDDLMVQGRYSHVYSSDSLVILNLKVVKQSQAIDFELIPETVSIGSTVTLLATASSGLPVSFTVSNPQVARIFENSVTFIGAGTTDIKASQAGNENFEPAETLSQTITVDYVTAIGLPVKESLMRLYPNPTSSQITIELSGYYANTYLNIIIMDARGVVVYNTKTSNRETETINVERLNPGLYFIQLKQGTRHTEQKFIKY